MWLLVMRHTGGRTLFYDSILYGGTVSAQKHSLQLLHSDQR